MDLSGNFFCYKKSLLIYQVLDTLIYLCVFLNTLNMLFQFIPQSKISL